MRFVGRPQKYGWTAVAITNFHWSQREMMSFYHISDISLLPYITLVTVFGNISSSKSLASSKTTLSLNGNRTENVTVMDCKRTERRVHKIGWFKLYNLIKIADRMLWRNLRSTDPRVEETLFQSTNLWFHVTLLAVLKWSSMTPLKVFSLRPITSRASKTEEGTGTNI